MKPVVSVAALMLAVALLSSARSDAGTLATTVYWGAYINGAPYDMSRVTAFENEAKKKVSIVHFGQAWQDASGVYQAFPGGGFDAIRLHGSIPMLTWGSYRQGWNGPNHPEWRTSVVYGGTYDSYIRGWATAAKAWGKPFFLRFDWEMNGSWYPWGEGKKSGVIANGNKAGDYVKMWRHVHDIFTSVGARNVTWVWCPNIQAVSSDYPALSTLYPGDAYVDWTCMDGYNNYSTWLNLQGIFKGVGTESWLRNTYQSISDVAPSKPLMIGETGSNEAGDGGAKKGQWFVNALQTELPYYLPKVKAFVYFNWNNNNPSSTIPIESSQASITGFAAGIASPYYASNAFGGLAGGPIAPLR